MPESGHVLASLAQAEAEFAREVTRRHPDSPKTVAVGKYQGGWAPLVLSATNTDIVGPIDEMASHTVEMLRRFHRMLELDPGVEEVLNDPLAHGSAFQEIGTAAE